MQRHLQDSRNFNGRVEKIDQPGQLLDGGDVLKCPATNRVYVGLSDRTSHEGISRLQAILPNHDVVAIPTTKALHLKSTITALPDGTIIGYEPVIDDSSVFGSFLSMPEEAGAHVVILDDNELLMSSSAPESIAILEGKGFRVHPVDIEQFEKLEGCVTCLSVRYRNCF